jgi:polyisoprenoid-binding protein YceI
MLALVALLLCAPPPGQLLDLREGTLTYTVVHKLHEVRGTSHQVEGRALAQPDGNVKVQVRVRVATFDSGNSNRDEHMREATHEQSHPYAEVKGTFSGVTLPLRQPQQATLHGTVELNGEKQAQDVAVKLEPAGGGVRVTFAFPLSLGAFKVERPQLLFIKIDDRAIISGDLRFEAAR